MTHQPTPRAFVFVMIAVGALATATVALSVYYTVILSSRDWCATLLGAKNASNTPPNVDLLKACAALNKKQIGSVAINSYVNSASIAICLVGLVILGVVGGRFAFKAGKEGVEGEFTRDAADAADHVADAAVDAAKEVKQ